MTEWLIDGQPGDSVPADDRGLLYGDALFETMAWTGQDLPLWRWHRQRLSDGAERLGLPLPEAGRVYEEVRQLAAGQRCIIRLTLTRGSGGQAYRPPEAAKPRRILQRRDWPESIVDQRCRGLKAVTSQISLASGSLLAGLKHGNRLEQVLAARDCAARQADEALLYDTDGALVEAIASNLLLVIDGQVLTPAIESAGVAGVGLAWLAAQPEVAVQPAWLNADDVERAEEVVVINSVAGIRPLVEIDGRALAIGAHCRNWQELWTRRVGI